MCISRSSGFSRFRFQFSFRFDTDGCALTLGSVSVKSRYAWFTTDIYGCRPNPRKPCYFGHLDPDINCVFHAIGRFICLGGVRGFFISVRLSVSGCGIFC